jgi:hypothetical protein
VNAMDAEDVEPYAMTIPKMYAWGRIQDLDPVQVMERTDEALWLRFQGYEEIWAMSWGEYAKDTLKGWLVFDAQDLEEWGPAL